MPVKQGDQVYLDAFCPQCETTYYRSIRPLVVGQDKFTPELFEPIKAGTPPPDPDQPVCPTCRGRLRFVAVGGSETAHSVPAQPVSPAPASPAEGATKATAGQATAGRAADFPVPHGTDGRAADIQIAPMSGSTTSSLVDTLFQVGLDEQVLDIKDSDGAYLVVTNKRIVRVRY